MATRPERKSSARLETRGEPALSGLPERRDLRERRRVAVPPCCRCCGAALTESFADLGMPPLADAYVAPEDATEMEPFYPLCAHVCSDCRLVQLSAFESPQTLFSDYLYFSSVSESCLRHAGAYAERMVEWLGLGPQTPVVEVASNDGYLLQYFQRAGVPVLGVDPAANVAQSAIARGIPTEVAFFGAATARRLRATRPAPVLMVAHNVLAHVPDLHDFIEGFRILLAPGGVATFEFEHLLGVMRDNALDALDHDHLSSLSLLVAELLLGQHGLTVFDAEELPGPGHGLRLFVRHAEDTAKPVTREVERIRAEEREAGLEGPEAYARFARGVVDTKCALLDFLVGARRGGWRVAGYGAPPGGNTLLNYCGVGPDLLPFTVDRSPQRQGLLLPGTRIPIEAPEAILRERPDFLLILPWGERREVMERMDIIRDWGGRFVVALPSLRVL